MMQQPHLEVLLLHVGESSFFIKQFVAISSQTLSGLDFNFS